MCGINGIFKFTEMIDLDRNKLLSMNKQMIYRGPDENDLWINEKAGLSQVRLSIIGVNNGRQPIFNEDESMLIICNGEVYNYKEIKKELEEKGHVFKTDSDTEVILHLFEEKKEGCLDDLRGMYAFAIYDIKNEKMFLARDAVGKKPIYYSITHDSFIFSSEITSIKNNYLKESDIDWGNIKDCLKYSYPQQLIDTHIKQIKRMQPAEYAYVSNNGVSFHKYWKKKNNSTFVGSYEDAKKEALNILRESVKLRLRSDVPVAILLSGGIDSSAIASIASETNNNIYAITVGYKGAPSCDERKLARRLAKEKNIKWCQVELDENDYEKYFEEYVNYIDEPVCDVSSIAQWGIYKKAKELGFKVLLSGNGGDEIFYGYPSHNKSRERLEIIEQLIKQPSKKRLKFLLTNVRKFLDVLKNYENKPFGSFHYQSYSNLKYDWEDKFEFSNTDVYKNYYNDEKRGVDKVYSYLFNVWLPNNCYYLSDKLGMGNSLELRSPFADKKLIEFVASLPFEYRYHSGNPKGFIKDVLRGVVPDYILDAKKQGFTPPANAINAIIRKYEAKFFNTKLTTYNQVLVDKFLSLKVKK